MPCSYLPKLSPLLSSSVQMFDRDATSAVSVAGCACFVNGNAALSGDTSLALLPAVFSCKDASRRSHRELQIKCVQSQWRYVRVSEATWPRVVSEVAQQYGRASGDSERRVSVSSNPPCLFVNVFTEIPTIFSMSYLLALLQCCIILWNLWIYRHIVVIHQLWQHVKHWKS